MPTITGTKNYDELTIAANGELFTVSLGASLTINSDNYWAQTGKVSGALDNYGAVLIDGRDVWWIQFDAGSGNVPALPTYNTNTVTVGGTAVGEFLGVWDALGKTIPMTPGVAMPATGYVKLRRKTGAIADNDVLTFANGATAQVNSSTGGQRGWITPGSASTSWQTWHRAATFSVLGDWFELGVANGSAGQQLQHYCFDAVPAIQVETGAGTGVYEWWCCVVTRANWTTSFFDTSERSKNFDVSATGLITFNSGGTVGALPPAGARIRVPNVHVLGYSTFGTGAAAIAGRQPAGTITVASGSTAVAGSGTAFDSTFVGLRIYNLTGGLVGTVASVASTTSLTLAAGALLAVSAAGYVIQQSLQARSNNFGGISFFYRAESDLIFDKCTGQFGYTGGAKTFTFQNCASGGGGHQWSAQQIIWEDCGLSVYSERPTLRSFQVSNSVPSGYVNSFKNLVMTGFTNENQPTSGIALTTFNAVIEGWRIIHKTAQFTNTITATNSITRNCFFGKAVAESGPAMTFAGTDHNVEDIDVAFGRIGSPATTNILSFNNSGVVQRIRNTFGTASGAGVFQVGNTNGALVIRKIGTPAAKQNFGGSVVFTASAVPKEMYMSEIYLTGYTVGFDNFTFGNYGLVFYRSELDGVTGLTPVVNFAGVIDNDWRRVYASFSGGANYSAFPGTHRLELVNSTTAPTEITLWTWFQRPSFLDKSKLTMSASAGLVIPDWSATSCALETAGQFVINESYYYLKGITGFVNANPSVFQGSGPVVYSYDLDRGTGFTGTWKTATGANLSAETNISPAGLRIKVRAQASSSAVGTFAGILQIRCTTTTAAIADHKYGSKVVEHTVSGIQPGSVAYLFRTDTGALIAKTREVTTGLLSLYPEWTVNIPVVLRVRDQGFATITSAFTLAVNGFNTPVTQLANTISTAVPSGSGITVTNHGASPVTWNGKAWSITITVTGGQTPAEIAQFIHYWLNQDAGTFDAALANAAFHDLVIPAGTGFETARGAVYGSAGAALKGVRVVDGSGAEIPGFIRMQADDGSYYSPAASYTLTVSGIVSGSRLLLRRTDTGAVIANTAVTGTSYTYTYTYSADIPVEIVVRNATGSPAYQQWRTTTTLAASNNSQTANQLLDE
jgi:hypothetical protein